jgi:hypothetical protein
LRRRGVSRPATFSAKSAGEASAKARHTVMAGLVPAIHVLLVEAPKTWMPAFAGMTLSVG